MRTNEKKRAAVLALPAPQRYSHFIKVVGDQHRLWALYREGWALMGAEDGVEVLPVCLNGVGRFIRRASLL